MNRRSFFAIVPALTDIQTEPVAMPSLHYEAKRVDGRWCVRWGPDMTAREKKQVMRMLRAGEQ